jgi:RNA polymerase sigma factor (sigma-70 family)
MLGSTISCKGSNNRDGISRFWCTNRGSLLRICKRWSRGNLADAEDLLGEACLRVLEAHASASVAPERPFAWWATIIANTARDHARKRERRLRSADELRGEMPGLAHTALTLPDEHCLLRDAIREVRCGMSGLTGHQQMALTLRGLGDDYEEIARKLGTSSTNARKLVQVARRTLRDRMSASIGSAVQPRAA